MVFSLEMLKRTPRNPYEFKHLRKFNEAMRKKKYWEDRLRKIDQTENPEKYQTAYLNSNYWEIVIEDESQYIEHLFKDDKVDDSNVTE